MSDYDLVIRRGSLVDGTGAPQRTADVAVADGVIVEVGRVGGRGRREIDADGALVTPGFVDAHTHYDGQATWESTLVPSTWHGVTTLVVGNCGVGFAPVRSGEHNRLVELMEGVEDIPGTALHEGLSWEWTSFGDFLGAIDARPHDADVCAYLPHSAVRFFVMGAEALTGEEPTPAQIDEMAQIVHGAMVDGAVGVSTSRTRAHKSIHGEPIPSLSAPDGEILRLAEAMGASGRGVFQLVSDYVPIDTEFSLFEQIVERSGRPLTFSLAQSPPVPTLYRDLLDRLEAANAAGLPMTGQVAPRGVGVLFGLDTTLNPFSLNPRYKDLLHLPVAERASAMREPGIRAEIIAATSEDKDDLKVAGRLIYRFDRMFEFTGCDSYEPDPSESLLERATREGRRPEELALDILSKGDGTGLIYLFLLNYVDGTLDSVGEMLGHQHTVPGLGDGGAHVGSICDASFPTTLLRHWGRDRPHGLLPVEFLVQRQTSGTAALVGLRDRGVVAEGFRADLNVIDFDRLRELSPHVVHDLPAGGRRLLQRAEGYTHTFIRGIETYADGTATGELPGGLVRLRS